MRERRMRSTPSNCERALYEAPVALAGAHQKENAALAIAALSFGGIASRKRRSSEVCRQ